MLLTLEGLLGLCGGGLVVVVVVVGFVSCVLRGIAVVFLAVERVSSEVSCVERGWGVLV